VPTWTAEAVRRAAAEWVWVPPDAEQVLTDSYQLIAREGPGADLRPDPAAAGFTGYGEERLYRLAV
jgi:hypothetical protein